MTQRDKYKEVFVNVLSFKCIINGRSVAYILLVCTSPCSLLHSRILKEVILLK